MADSVHEIDQLIGARLRLARIQKGFTQQQLAQMLGVSFQQIQKYEKGLNRLAASSLFRAAVALDVHPLEFFPTWNGAVDGAANIAADFDQALPLVEAFVAIKSAKLRRTVIKIVQQVGIDDDDQ